MMMTTTEMSKTMQEFFEDYNGRVDEINRLNDELAAVKAELAKLGIEFDRVNIEFRKATEELGETKEKLRVANAVIADIRPKERPDFGVRSFKYLGETWYPATDLLYKKGYRVLNLRRVLGKKMYIAHAKKFRFSDMYDRIESGKIKKAPRGEVWCVDEIGAQVILQNKRKEYEPVSREMEVEIVELYESGMSRRNIASEIGRSYSTVNYVLARNGQRKKRSIISENEITEIVELYESGMSRRNIASETGFCYETVRRVLATNGHGRKKAV